MPAAEFARMRPLLGTFVQIRAAGAPPALEPAVRAAFAEIERVQRLMSFHDPDSDVSRINAAPPDRPLAIAAQTHAVLRAAQRLSALSGGLFDVVTAAPLVRQGFLPPPAGRHDPLHASPIPDRTTYRDLELLPDDRVRWRHKGWIDLGGIAKGYAVDQAIEVLQSAGIVCGVVNAGGDLRCFGAPERIHLRAPDDPRMLLDAGMLTDAAIATSADYFRTRESDGQQIGTLVDPRYAECALWRHSVSVVARDCMTADALTKAVALAPERAPAWLEQLDAEALIVDRRGVRRCGRSWLSSVRNGSVAA